MNILITGGTGYIGSHLAVTLLTSGYKVILFDNLSNSSTLVLNQIRQITGESPIFIEGDIRNQRLVRDSLSSYKIDVVFHLAGLKAVGDSVLNPLEYYSVNVAGAMSLLLAMKSAGVKKVIFSSSATVYGDPQYLPIDESHPTCPANPYGRSKLQVEKILEDLVASDGEWRVVCLRYFNPVGAHKSGLIGESNVGLPNNLMPYIVQVAAKVRAELHVFGGDYSTIDGTGVRDYIHVMDLVEGHSLAIDFMEKTEGGMSVFNLGTGRGLSVFELVHEFERVNGQNIPFKIVGRRTGDVDKIYASSEVASQKLGWRATRSVSDMCVSAWRFQCSQFRNPSEF